MRSRAEKKTPDESPRPSRALPDSAHLSEGYEALRASVLEADLFSATCHGLSIFLDQGMTAWMHVYQLLPSPSLSEDESPFRCPSSGLADEVAVLIADLFFNRQEVFKC